VAGSVQKTPGGIGYVELAYAIQAKLNYGPIRTKGGKYVEPSVDSTTAAANASLDELKKDIRTSIVDTAAPDGYPIAGFTFHALISKTPKGPRPRKSDRRLYEVDIGTRSRLGEGIELRAPAEVDIRSQRGKP